MAKTILILDDEAKLRSLLARILRLEGYEVLEAATAKSAWQLLESSAVQVMLCDVKLPDAYGVDLVAELKKMYPHIEIILLTAYGNIPDGVTAIKNGAFNYITKGDDNDKILPLLAQAFAQAEKNIQTSIPEATANATYGIVGKSAAIQQAIALARRVAVTNTTVLLTGETGTGKEVFANTIHQASPRHTKPFVALNCSTFSKEILESELFGHRAGAFTGATKDKKGLLEEAHTGTLFLDEIGELPIELQAKLLRVLETQTFFKVGDTKPSNVDVRLIAATNRNLQTMSEQGAFRSDLYYRLAVFQIQLPPLRDRLEDIELLVAELLPTLCRKIGVPMPTIQRDFIAQLRAHAWQGNVRELKNVLERSLILMENGVLQTTVLPNSAITSTATPATFQLIEIERAHIQKVLQHTNGNKPEAARLLNIGLTTLYRKIEEFGL